MTPHYDIKRTAIEKLPDGKYLKILEHETRFFGLKPPHVFLRAWKTELNEFHRTGEPAVTTIDGDYQAWYQQGILHREDGPAIIWLSRDIEEWYKDGEKYEPSAHEIMVWKMKKKE